jgi:RNA polymerase sigma factor (sigma-70 family)
MGLTPKASEPEQFIPTRTTLLSRLRNLDDQESWRDFFDLYWRLIYSTALKAGLSDAEAQDVVQETIIAVAKNMPEFHYDPARGHFKGWLLQVTRRRIVDQLRKRPPPGVILQSTSGDETTATPLVEQIPDPTSLNWEAAWEQEWEQSLLDAAIDHVRERVDAAQYQLFDFHVLKHWPASKVARKFGVGLGTVYFAKYKIWRLAQKEIKRLEGRTG